MVRLALDFNLLLNSVAPFNSILERDKAYRQNENPGPGTYDFQQIGAKNYYATSKFRNYTNHKISPGSRLANIGRRSTEIGPGSYSVQVEDLNPQGRYNLSNH